MHGIYIQFQKHSKKKKKKYKKEIETAFVCFSTLLLTVVTLYNLFTQYIIIFNINIII